MLCIFSLSIIAVFLLSSLALDARQICHPSKEFKLNKPGFEEAWKHVANGDVYYGEKGICTVMHLMNICKALLYNIQMPSWTIKQACRLLSGQKRKKQQFFSESYRTKERCCWKMFFTHGRSLQYAGRFSEANRKIYGSWLTRKKSQKNTFWLGSAFRM